jgi:hypothetical protein
MYFLTLRKRLCKIDVLFDLEEEVVHVLLVHVPELDAGPGVILHVDSSMGFRFVNYI